MNTSNIILFVLSLVFIIIRGDRNDSNTSISDRDIRIFMDDFADSLKRLYTQSSKVVLDEIMDYFDEDDREICIVAECYRKEMGNHNVRQYLKDNLMGKYHEAKITVKPKIRPSSSPELGYFVKVNTAKYLTEIVNNNRKCSALSVSQCIFLLNTDDDNELYITKWIQISAPDSPAYDYHDDDCEPLGNDDNDDPDCMPGTYCPVTNEADKNKIRGQLDSIHDILVSALAADDIKWSDLMPTIKSMKSQDLKDGGKNINVILEDDKTWIEIIIDYYVSAYGEINKGSVSIETILPFPVFPSTTDDADDTDDTDCRPGVWCDVTDNGTIEGMLLQFNLWNEEWYPNRDNLVSLQSQVLEEGEIKVRYRVEYRDNNGDNIVIEYYVSRDDGFIPVNSYKMYINGQPVPSRNNCMPEAYCQVTDDQEEQDIMNQFNQFNTDDNLSQQLSNAKFVYVFSQLMMEGSNIRIEFGDNNGDNKFIEYHVTKDGIVPESFEVYGEKQDDDEMTN